MFVAGLRGRSAVMCAMALLSGALASAQDAEKKPQTAQPGVGITALLDNIDVLVDNYANFVSRKYALTPEQDVYARALIRERAHGFLDKHDEPLRALLDKLFAVRGGTDISPEDLKSWGQRIMPIYEDAKQIIITSNTEFRGVLTEEQLKIHDEDLKLANDTFATTEDQLKRVVSGEMSLEEFRNPNLNRKGKRPNAQTVNPVRPQPQPPVVNTEPVPHTGPESDPAQPRRMTPPDESGGGGHVTQPVGDSKSSSVKTVGRPDAKASRGGGTGYEGEWDKYLREFMEKYQLNPEQRQQAETILTDCKAQAQKIVASHKSQIEALDAKEAEVRKSTDKDKSKTLADLAKDKQKILEPIGKIFDGQLKPRLDRIPTRAQRKAAEEAKPKSPAKPVAKAPAEPAKPAEPPATQPAADGDDE